ncbi:hypothetical protein HT819_003920 [Salmonella enterica]|nr:hypothetical protein [Salmonella enterica]
MANQNLNIVTSDDKDGVKAAIETIVTNYKSASKGFANLFIGLCERFTGKDSCTGSMFEHLLNKLGDDQKSLRGAVISRLQDFSGDTLNIAYIDDKQVWKVETKKAPKTKDGKIVREGLRIVYTDKSVFNKDLFIANVAKAKSSANPLKPLEIQETNEQKAARLAAEKRAKYVTAVKDGKIKDKIAESLKDYIVTSIEVTDETKETLAIKLKKMIDDLLQDEKPAIEGETAK